MTPMTRSWSRAKQNGGRRPASDGDYFRFIYFGWMSLQDLMAAMRNTFFIQRRIDVESRRDAFVISLKTSPEQRKTPAGVLDINSILNVLERLLKGLKTFQNRP